MRKVIKLKSSSTVYRKKLIKFIFRENTKIRPYLNCIRTGEKYITDRDHDKYTGCIKSVKVSYNLIIS